MLLVEKRRCATVVVRCAAGLFFGVLFGGVCRGDDVAVVPLKVTGIYDQGEKAGWTVKVAEGATAPTGKYSFVLKKNNLEQIKSGEFDLSSGSATIDATLDEPAMLYLDITPPPAEDGSNKKHLVAGAAVAPTKLVPSAPRPDDFDSFWAEKIKWLKEVPENAVLTPKESGKEDVDYATIQMDHVNGTHVYGQIAKPKKEGKFPALVIFQWASPPYALQKQWVTDHAAKGWLTLNIEPHDVLPDQPRLYYDALPKEIKNYQSIGNNDRDKSYFLEMYLRDYRAVDYIASRPDWDGKTLVVMGTSMGGQQSLCVAGLHPKVTHVIVNEPAGCDTNGPLHGRQSGYPNFPSSSPKIMETALYFDAVNFAPHIKGPALVAMGFVDTIAPPVGIWTAFDQIPGAKEAAPMIDSPHNNSATRAQQMPYTNRSAEWLDTLASDRELHVNGAVASGAVASSAAATGTAASGAAANSSAASGAPANSEPEKHFDDHRNMMEQLRVKALRRGADPNNQSTFNEDNANPYKDSMPDVLKMKDGTPVTRAEQWPARRAEIAEDFEREIYGRIPDNVPAVTWKVVETTTGESGGIPTITKKLEGHVDNSAYPQLTVNIDANFTVPAEAKSPVPMMLVFGFGGNRRGPPRAMAPPMGKPWTQQAIEKGWGYGTIVPTSFQQDNNKLTTGIIGLTNKGEPRKPDQWGDLRAWQWGVSRLIDYFEANPDSMVDAKKIGIEGLSRYGKAAIVTEAFEPRIAVGLIGSSGEGGVKLHRHIFGEAVENLTGGEYNWMAGNFIKYGASDPPKTAADLPVDAHELIAMCAPRPCFISYGVVEKGDAKWVDSHGSFMAGVLASPVYELLGKKGFGTPGDYLTDAMPPVGQLIGGELAWRQHEGGHDVTPNWPAFFEWVGNYISAPVVPVAKAPAEQKPEGSAAVPKESTGAAATKAIELAQNSADAPVRGVADTPAPRTDANSKLAHEQLIEKAKQGGIDVYFLGDSITRRWGCSDRAWSKLLENWKKNFYGWNAGDFGWGADSIQNILWRIQNGELDGVHPKVIVLLAGTNNIGSQPADDAKIEDITHGLKAIVNTCQEKAPEATIILTGIFPRNDNMAVMPAINKVNENLAKMADGKKIRFLNVNDKLADADGKLFDGMMNAQDKLHPTVQGYQVWADGLKPILTDLLGPPAETDHAPPPTGDPSAAPKPAPPKEQ